MNNDILKLNVSNSFTLTNNNEADINLNLNPPSMSTTGSVNGVVYDTTLLTGNVVPGATVKVFTTDGTPFAHTITDENGNYTISDLPIGIYTISAVKDGTYLSVDTPLTISNTLPVTVNLALISNNLISKNIIYGTLKDSVNNIAIDNVNVALYKVEQSGNTLISTTKTIADGEYVLDKIDDGTYEVIFSKDGYQTLTLDNIALSQGTMFNASTNLTSTIGTINSTVSGIVTDELGVAVANAFVGLYKMVNGVETLVAVTYTNTFGKYMFGNVVEGEYFVKAKLA